MQLNEGAKYMLTVLGIVGAVAAGVMWMESRIDRRINRAEGNIMGEVCANRAAIYALASDEPVVNFDTGCNPYNGANR